MIFYSISHKWMKKCENQQLKFTICTGPYKLEKYSYKVVDSNKKKEKICIQVIVKYVNCKRNYTTNFLQCTLKHKANIEVKKKEKKKKLKKKKLKQEIWQIKE